MLQWWLSGAGGGEDRELFHGCRGSVWGAEKAPERNSGDDCTATGMPLNGSAT